MYETPDVILAADAGHGYGNKQRGKPEVIAPLPPATEDIDCKYPAERTVKGLESVRQSAGEAQTVRNVETGNPIKQATPEKADVFRGSAGVSASLRKRLIPEVGVEQPAFPPEKTPLSENGGTPGGTVEPNSERIAHHRRQAMADLERASGSFHSWQAAATSDDETKAVERLRRDLAKLMNAAEQLGGKEL